MEGTLHEGDSAFAVSEDCNSLEFRIDEALHAAYGKAEKEGASKTQTVADHLRTEFSEAYGLKPGPSVAHAHAVTAVEGVANPLFLPNAAEPTLGIVRSH